MSSFENRRKRLGSTIAVALGALAIVALPGLATARDDSSQSTATIKSFDPESRTLTISLPDGGTVTGLVTRRTKIRCEDQSGNRGRHGGDRIRARESGSGSSGHDDNGRGANCTTADLVAGATVDEVELDFHHGGVRFDEVELDD